MSKSSLFVSMTLSILLFFFTPGVVAAVLPQTMAPPVETPQLSPTQCHLARTQCPSLQLTGHQLDNDVDPQLLELRRQYEHNLDRLKVYVSRIVDLLKTQPEARPLITLCAEMGDPLTDEAKFGNAQNPATTPSPSTPAPPTTTTTTTTQKTETTTEQSKTDTTKEEMTTTTTTAMTTKKMEAESSTSRPATTAPTAAVTTMTTSIADPSAPVFTENSSNTFSLAATATITTAAPTTTPTDTAAPAAAETTTTLEMTTTSSTTTSTTASTTLAAQCLVSPWSEWSRPYGFGVQSRKREIVHPGFSCPEDGHLTELRPFEQTGWTLTQLSQNYTLVGDNFDRDFLRAMDGPTDILVILDASRNDDPEALTNIKNAVKEMLGLFCGEFGDQLTHNRFSLITYSTVAHGSLFQDAQTLPSLMNMVDSIRVMEGATCTTKALEQAFTLFQPAFGARQNARHVTLLITTSTSNCLNTDGNHNIDTKAEELRKVSEVYAMGVGVAENPVAREEVQKIVTDSDHKRIFSLSSYADFNNMMMSVKEGRNGATC